MKACGNVLEVLCTSTYLTFFKSTHLSFRDALNIPKLDISFDDDEEDEEAEKEVLTGSFDEMWRVGGRLCSTLGAAGIISRTVSPTPSA